MSMLRPYESPTSVTTTLRCVPSMAAVSMLVPILQYIRLQQMTRVEDTLRVNIEFKTCFKFSLHTICHIHLPLLLHTAYMY